jgi:hypothetical protein
MVASTYWSDRASWPARRKSLSGMRPTDLFLGSPSVPVSQGPEEDTFGGRIADVGNIPRADLVAPSKHEPLYLQERRWMVGRRDSESTADGPSSFLVPARL